MWRIYHLQEKNSIIVFENKLGISSKFPSNILTVQHSNTFPAVGHFQLLAINVMSQFLSSYALKFS